MKDFVIAYKNKQRGYIYLEDSLSKILTQYFNTTKLRSS